jgi:hypothetical protein
MSHLVRTLLAATALAGLAGAAWGTPSESFDLSNWKLTLPLVDEEDGDALEVHDLAGYQNPDYFFAGPDGAMVFVAVVDGATTEGSSYPRSELREMRDGDEAEWKLDEGGTMTATLTVDEVPVRHYGPPGRVIIGQIHGEDAELIRLYYEYGTVYFENEQSGDDGKEHEFPLQNEAGEFASIDLGETFSYLIDARGDTLTVEVHADGQVYSSVTPINEVWQSDTFYFKAGVYLGVNAESGTGRGQVSFYALDMSHEAGAGRGGLQ